MCLTAWKIPNPKEFTHLCNTGVLPGRGCLVHWAYHESNDNLAARGLQRRGIRRSGRSCSGPREGAVILSSVGNITQHLKLQLCGCRHSLYAVVTGNCQQCLIGRPKATGVAEYYLYAGVTQIKANRGSETVGSAEPHIRRAGNGHRLKLCKPTIRDCAPRLCLVRKGCGSHSQETHMYHQLLTSAGSGCAFSTITRCM